MTPLQLAHAYAVFANEGRMVPLTLLAQTSQYNDQSASGGRQIISPVVAEKVVTVLHRVTGPEGTAQRATVSGFDVGGKTGTVHKVGREGYLDDRYVALFAGVAPVESPRYVTVVVIDEPEGDVYGGGAAAAPVYSRITQEVLRIQNVVPNSAEPCRTAACWRLRGRVIPVPEMNLATLTQSVAQVPASVNGLMATGLSLDSRTIESGGVFVAMQGLASDGRAYIDAAFARGAVAVLAEAEGLESSDSRVIPIQGLKAQLGEIARRFYADPSKDLSLLAVTGTNGKTSITDYIGQLLRLLGASAGTIGTLGARTRAGEAVDAQNTTPDILSLNQHLADWRDEGVRHVAIEASSHALEQGRLDGLTVHTGVFSNLTRDHLDYHGDLESYRSAKLRLFNDFLPSRVIYNAMMRRHTRHERRPQVRHLACPLSTQMPTST